MPYHKYIEMLCLLIISVQWGQYLKNQEVFWFMQGLMEHHKEIVEYFNQRSVSVIFLFRRNLLRRMVSMIANSFDRHAKLLNGTHKSHVHSAEEVCLVCFYIGFSFTWNVTHDWQFLLGWCTCKVQACDKFYVIAGWLEGNGDENCEGFRILQ